MLPTTSHPHDQYNHYMGPHDSTEYPIRPHVCPIAGCPRRFKRRFTLKEHVKTHSGAKPYVCPVPSCRKSFTTSGNLSRHKHVHPWLNTTFECLIDGCECSFTTEKKLERHVKMAHFGSSAHLCPQEHCGGTFSTAGNLKRHMQLQHHGVVTNPAANNLESTLQEHNRSSPATVAAFIDNQVGEDEFTWPVGTAVSEPSQSLLLPTDVELLDALSCLFDTDSNNVSTIV